MTILGIFLMVLGGLSIGSLWLPPTGIVGELGVSIATVRAAAASGGFGLCVLGIICFFLRRKKKSHFISGRRRRKRDWSVRQPDVHDTYRIMASIRKKAEAQEAAKKT